MLIKVGVWYAIPTLHHFTGRTVTPILKLIPVPERRVRAGYIYSGNNLRNGWEDVVMGHTIPTRQQYVTAGIGLKFTRTVYLDLAYQYGTTNYTKHQTFYFTDAYDADYDLGSRIFEDKVSRHIAVVTLGFRF